MTLADITVVCNLLLLYKQVSQKENKSDGIILLNSNSQVLEPNFRAPYTNVNRWFVTCINQSEFSAVLGQVQLCSKMAQFDGESG